MTVEANDELPQLRSGLVLSKNEHYMAVAQAGQAAGPASLAAVEDPRLIAATSVIGGGEEVTGCLNSSSSS